MKMKSWGGKRGARAYAKVLAKDGQLLYVVEP